MATFNMASAAAPSWPSLLAFRFLAGTGSTAAMVVSGGIIADILPRPAARGMANSWLMVNTTLGSVFGSVVSTAVYARWPERWNFGYWINGGASILAFLLLLLLPETRHQLTTGHGHSDHLPLELSRLGQMMLPIRMLLFEPIVTFTCLFLSIVYAIYYLLFQLVPPAFLMAYGWESKDQDINFVPLAVATVIAGIVFTVVDPMLQAWSQKEKLHLWAPKIRRLPLACLGGGFVVLSLSVLGYAVGIAALPNVAMLSLGMFGLGFLLLFMTLTNYLADAYKVSAIFICLNSVAVADTASGLGCECLGTELHLSKSRRRFLKLRRKAPMGLDGPRLDVLPTGIVKHTLRRGALRFILVRAVAEETEQVLQGCEWRWKGTGGAIRDKGITMPVRRPPNA
jgi:MFS family permease